MTAVVLQQIMNGVTIGAVYALIALGLIFLVISWSWKEQPDPRPTGTVGVKKGDRIGTPTEPHPPR